MRYTLYALEGKADASPISDGRPALIAATFGANQEGMVGAG